MRKPIFLTIILLLILMPYAFSDKKLLSTVKLGNGGTIQINGTEYSVKVGRSDSVGLARGQEVITLQVADCVAYGEEELCLYSKEDNKSATFRRYDLNARLIYRIGMNTSMFIAGETRTFNFTINNTGGSTAEDVLFEQEYPEGFVIGDPYGCRIEGKKVFYRGSIDADELKNCRYKATIQKVMAANIKSRLNYTSFGKKESVAVPDKQISSFLPFQYTISTDLKNVTVGQNITIFLNISVNSSRHNMTIVFARIRDDAYLKRIYGQYEDTRLHPSELIRGKKVLFNKTDVSSEATYSLMKDPPNSTIEIEVRYRIDEEYTYMMQLPLEVIDKGMAFNLTYNEISTPGSSETISISPINENRYLIFTSPILTAYSDIPGFKDAEVRLKERNVERIIYTVPEVNRTQNYNFTLSITYYDQFRNMHIYRRSFNVTAMKLGELRIRKSLEYKDGTDGKEAFLKVTLINDVGIDLYNVIVGEPLLGIKRTVNLTKSQSFLAIDEKIGSGAIEKLKEDNSTITVVEYSAGGRQETRTRAIEIDPLKIEEATRPSKPAEPIQENKTINTTSPQAESMATGIGMYAIYIISAIAVIAIIFGILLWKKRSKKNAPESDDSSHAENPVDSSNSEDTPKKESGHTLSDIDRLSELEDEMTSLLSKAEDDPEYAELALEKEKEYEELKRKIDGL